MAKEKITITTLDMDPLIQVGSESQMWNYLRSYRDEKAKPGDRLLISKSPSDTNILHFKATKAGKLQMKIEPHVFIQDKPTLEKKNSVQTNVNEMKQSTYAGYKFISKELQGILKECEAMTNQRFKEWCPFT